MQISRWMTEWRPGLFLFGGAAVGSIVLLGRFILVLLAGGGRDGRVAVAVHVHVLLGARRPTPDDRRSRRCAGRSGRTAAGGSHVVTFGVVMEIGREIQIGVLEAQHDLSQSVFELSLVIQSHFQSN